MTREQKIIKRKERAHRRRIKKNDIYHMKIKAVKNLGNYIPLSAVDRNGIVGSWADSSSSTGYMQKCSYDVYGTCESPCNGDC